MNIWNFLTHGASTEILPPRYEEGSTFASLDHKELAEIAHQMLQGMARASHVPLAEPAGLLSIPARGLSQLMNAIPGLRTLDADAMNAGDVERLCDYVRMRLPTLFVDVVERMSQEWPDAASVLEQTALLSPPIIVN
jgi:hypothetical protein